jgi:hypothetical protein
MCAVIVHVNIFPTVIWTVIVHVCCYCSCVIWAVIVHVNIFPTVVYLNLSSSCVLLFLLHERFELVYVSDLVI